MQEIFFKIFRPFPCPLRGKKGLTSVMVCMYIRVLYVPHGTYTSPCPVRISVLLFFPTLLPPFFSLAHIILNGNWIFFIMKLGKKISLVLEHMSILNLVIFAIYTTLSSSSSLFLSFTLSLLSPPHSSFLLDL